MATQVKFGTRRNAFEIHIRPLKDKTDREDLCVNVKSLVDAFETDPPHELQRSRSLDDLEGAGDDDLDTRNSSLGAAGVLKSRSSNKGLPDLIVCAQADDEDDDNDNDNDDDTQDEPEALSENETVLFAALKGVFEKSPNHHHHHHHHHYTQNPHHTSDRNKPRRIKLPKSVGRQRSIKEQVEDIFSPKNLRVKWADDLINEKSNAKGKWKSDSDIAHSLAAENVAASLAQGNSNNNNPQQEVVNIVLVESSPDNWTVAKTRSLPRKPILKKEPVRDDQEGEVWKPNMTKVSKRPGIFSIFSDTKPKEKVPTPEASINKHIRDPSLVLKYCQNSRSTLEQKQTVDAHNRSCYDEIDGVGGEEGGRGGGGGRQRIPKSVSITPALSSSRNKDQRVKENILGTNKVLTRSYRNVISELGSHLGIEQEQEQEVPASGDSWQQRQRHPEGGGGGGGAQEEEEWGYSVKEDEYEEEGDRPKKICLTRVNSSSTDDPEVHGIWGGWMAGDSDSPSSSSKHSGEVSSADLDFACVQSGSQLNVDANKQRAQLRQKGTLAGRRKPTRSSLRADLAEQVMVSPDDDDVQEEPMRASSSSPLEAMESRRAPILLPGLGEMANKSKLRPTRPPKPSVGDSPTSSPSSSSSPPPWLVEAKQRRASRQPKGEAEKMSKESEPEKPAWMKDALAKQQKRASITSTQSQQSQQSQQSDGPSTPPPTANEDPSTTTVTTAAPWLQERNLRKSRLQPTTHTNTSPVVEPVPPAKPSMNSTAPAANTIIINRSSTTESRVEQDENQPPAQKYPVLRPTPIIPTSARLSSSFSTDDEPAENTPTPVWRAEINERKKSKSYIHPLRLEQPMKLGETPAWKKELAEKRKSRRSSSTPSGTSADGGGGQSTVAADTIVQSSTHHDGDSTAENGVMSSSVPESEETEILPPWKLELERRKKRGSTGGGGGGGGGNRDSTPSPAMQSSAPAEDDVPEWIKAVEKRRSRLASAGYKT